MGEGCLAYNIKETGKKRGAGADQCLVGYRFATTDSGCEALAEEGGGGLLTLVSRPLADTCRSCVAAAAS